MTGVPVPLQAASGPLILGFAAFEGGLGRAAGIGHLVPWTPLLLWLPPRIAFDGSPASGFALVLALAVALCLAFDLADLVRWLRGERGIILGTGKPERQAAPPTPAGTP